MDTGAAAVLPQAEERASQKVAGILTTGKWSSIAQSFDAIMVILCDPIWHVSSCSGEASR